MERMARRGLTLIELMIVVGIIGILAVAGTVAMQEIQTRVKVTKVDWDMKVLSDAAEMHAIDYGRYPLASPEDNLEERLRDLTQPIGYLSKVPTDLFADTVHPTWGWSPQQDAYEMVTDLHPYHSLLFQHPGGWGCRQRVSPVARYYFASQGPDLERNSVIPDPGRYWDAYDPTNGSVSFGDVFRFGPGNPSPGL